MYGKTLPCTMQGSVLADIRLSMLGFVMLRWEEERPIGKWGRMHRAYLEDTNPLLLNHLILTGRIFTYLVGFVMLKCRSSRP